VIALAYKKLNNYDENIKDRDIYENDLTFLGFAILKNELKESTKDTIIELKKCDFKLTMITGDHLNTSINVSNECYILDSNKLLITMNSYDQVNLNIEHNGKNISLNDLKLLDLDDYEIAINNRSLHILIKLKDKEDINDELFNKIINNTKVFARMNPDDKQTIVKLFKNMNYVVGMCGDGANDCLALKEAHVGLALSNSESSLAAPFSSKKYEISSFIVLLKESRCALTTCFHSFKFMVLYSMIQSLTVCLLA